MTKAFSKISSRVKLAWDSLNDDTKRRAYRQEVVETNTIAMSAELLGKKGEMMIMKKDKREATLCFSKAAELEPRNPAHREGLSRARAVIS
jgi:Flp pilus assembly protein TadD